MSGEQGVAFDEGQRILHGSLVREFDLRCDVGSATAHKVDTDLTGENRIIAGNRLGARTQLLSEGGCDLAGIDRLAAMLVSEALLRDLCADPRPQCR